MGGSGSTRWGKGRLPPMVVEDCKWTLDADLFHRAGLFRPPIRVPESAWLSWEDGASIGCTLERDSGGGGIMLGLAFTKGPQNINQTILLQATRLYSVGLRWWFTCPLLCKRRARRLYIPPGRAEYGCRLCHSLTHDCRRHGYNSRSRMNRLLARHSAMSIEEVRMGMSVLRKLRKDRNS